MWHVGSRMWSAEDPGGTSAAGPVTDVGLMCWDRVCPLRGLFISAFLDCLLI